MGKSIKKSIKKRYEKYSLVHEQVKDRKEEFRERLNEIFNECTEVFNAYLMISGDYVTDVGTLTKELHDIQEKIKWHRLSEEKPEQERVVEVRAADDCPQVFRYDVAWMDENGEFWDGIGDSLRFEPAYWRYPELTEDISSEASELTSFRAEKISELKEKVADLRKENVSLQTWRIYQKETPSELFRGAYDITCAVLTEANECKIADFGEDGVFRDRDGNEIEDVKYWYNLDNLYMPDDDDI